MLVETASAVGKERESAKVADGDNRLKGKRSVNQQLQPRVARNRDLEQNTPVTSTRVGDERERIETSDLRMHVCGLDKGTPESG